VKPPLLESVFLVSLVTISPLVPPQVLVLSVLLITPTVVLLVVPPVRDNLLLPLKNGLLLSLIPVPSFPILPPLLMEFKIPPLVS